MLALEAGVGVGFAGSWPASWPWGLAVGLGAGLGACRRALLTKLLFSHAGFPEESLIPELEDVGGTPEREPFPPGR